jgi:hypothetical protein
MQKLRVAGFDFGLGAMGVLIVVLGFSSATFAVLGGKVASVATDQSRMKASLKVTSNRLFQVHELQTDAGNVVREYVSPDGTVFGIAWTGRQMPDYSQLLGSYTDAINKAAQSRKDHRAPLTIQQPGFVFSAFGHMRFFTGRAYIPGLVPAGVTAEEIR